MPTADCRQLETEFGVTLPGLWAAAIEEYPPELIDLLRPDGIRVFDCELCGDADHLAVMNREVRLAPIVDGDGMAFDWPEQLFVVGENAAGDYYCIDVNEPDPSVLFFDHQLCELADLDEGLFGFIEMLIDRYATDEQIQDMMNKGLLE